MQKPDFSTIVHEIAHVFEKDLTSDEKNTINKHGGSEVFARGFERYLRKGEAPIKEFKPLFGKFKSFLTTVYTKLKGSEISKKIHPEIKSIFDRLLTIKKTIMFYINKIC